MKQRELTDQQQRVIRGVIGGRSFVDIARDCAISEATARVKWAAIQRGLAKEAYLLPDDVTQALSKQQTLF